MFYNVVLIIKMLCCWNCTQKNRNIKYVYLLRKIYQKNDISTFNLNTLKLLLHYRNIFNSLELKTSIVKYLAYVLNEYGMKKSHILKIYSRAIFTSFLSSVFNKYQNIYLLIITNHLMWLVIKKQRLLYFKI